LFLLFVGGGDIENQNNEGSQGSADSTSPFQLQAGGISSSTTTAAPVPAPPAKVESIEVDID